jgi:hypothetical protein
LINLLIISLKKMDISSEFMDRLFFFDKNDGCFGFMK